MSDPNAVSVEFEKRRGGSFDTWSIPFETTGEAMEFAAQVVDDGQADRASINGITYSDGEWDGDFGDCLACDGYILDHREAPYCPSCARARKDSNGGL